MTSEGHFSTVLTLCAQLRRDLLAIAKCLVFCEPIMRETYKNTYFLVLRDKLIQYTELENRLDGMDRKDASPSCQI